MYRIAFVCDWDAADPMAMSGSAHSMRRAFLEAGHEVLDVFPTERDLLARAAAGAGLLIRIFHASRGVYHSHKREKAYLKAVAMYTERRLRGLGNYDFVFAPSGLPLGLARIDRPIFLTADQPFDAYVKGYIRNPSDRFLKIGRWMEERLAYKSHALIFPSTWARDEFLKVHGGLAEKVHVIQWGANFSVSPSKSEVFEMMKSRTTEQVLNLVFIGRDWERKRGQLAVDVAQIFHANGQPCKLTVVGAKPELPAAVKGDVIPFIDKSSQEGYLLLRKILYRSHFLIVPSRAEAYGQVFCEAAAFGVPSVAAAVGGIPSIIKDGENGICLPRSAGADAYYQRMHNIFQNREAYENMASKAHASFEEHLNWSAFARRVLKLAREFVPEPK
jgi:glycosyltransferase involved in cell wall biosynthesis